MNGEDDHLEMYYEDRNGGDVDSVDDSVRFDEDDDFEDNGEECEYVPECPVCGEPIDYCQGHGEVFEETPLYDAVVEAQGDIPNNPWPPDEVNL